MGVKYFTSKIGVKKVLVSNGR